MQNLRSQSRPFYICPILQVGKPRHRKVKKLAWTVLAPESGPTHLGWALIHHVLCH